MHVTYNDINSRLYAIKTTSHSGNRIQPRVYTESGVYCKENVSKAIYSWESLAETTDEAFEKALDLFEEACLNDSAANVKQYAYYLAEEAKKVRDASQLQNSINYRNSRLKTKVSTRINNKMNIVTNTIKDALQDTQNKLKVSPTTPPSPSAGVKSGSAASTDGVAEESFNIILSKVNQYKECDRIVNNYEKVSKRFNLDKIVTESMYPDDFYQAVWDIAECMDTYEVSFKKKYCCALENAKYVFDKHYIHYPTDKIVEAVTDYFIFTRRLDESCLQDIAKVANSTSLIDGEDFNKINFLYKDINSIDDINDLDPETDAEALTESYGVDFGFLSLDEASSKKKDNREKPVKDFVKSTVQDIKKGNPPESKEDKEVKDMMEKFRKDVADDPDNKNNGSRLKALINKFFTKTPYQIVNELPNFFGLIRAGLLIGTVAISVPVGCVAIIADQIVRLTLTRKQTQKIIDQYKKEIEKTQKKLDNAKGDSNKQKLQKYIDQLRKDLEKITQYRDGLHSDEENEERENKEMEEELEKGSNKKKSSNSDDKDSDDDEDWDLDWDDDEDWDDDDLEEAANIQMVADYVESISECLIDPKDLDGVIFGNVFKMDNDTIDGVTDFAVTIPDIINKEKLADALRDYRTELRESSTNVKDYMRIDILNDNIYKLEHCATPYNTTPDLQSTVYYLSCLNELAKFDKYDYYIIEDSMSFKNTIKLAIDRMKKAVMKLSDKEKKISDNIDASASQVSKSIERAVETDNREAIIRGSMIPSASKCIKYALGIGVAWAINPAIAVIGALGVFACKKKRKKKERQMVLDEIEIELKMVERYIRQAEDNNDMEKLRQYEMTQRSLQRQQQRIKYSMHVYHDKVIAPKENKD